MHANYLYFTGEYSAYAMLQEKILTTSPTKDELSEDISYINSLLSKYSIDCPFPFYSISSEFEKERAVKIVSQLLYRHQKDLAYREDAETRTRRLHEEIKEQTIKISQLTSNLEGRDAVLKTAQSNLLLVSEHASKLEAVVANLRDQISQLSTATTLKEKQFLHELRKKENEFERLKEQLQMALVDPLLKEQRAELATFTLEMRPAGPQPYEPISHENFVVGANEHEDLLLADNQLLRYTLAEIFSQLISLLHSLGIDQSTNLNYDHVDSLPANWIARDLCNDISAITQNIITAIEQ